MARSVEIRITTDANLKDLTNLTKTLERVQKELTAFNKQAQASARAAKTAAAGAKGMSTAFSGLSKSLTNVAPKMKDTTAAINGMRAAIKSFAATDDKLDDGFKDALDTFMKVTNEIKETAAALKGLGSTIKTTAATTNRLETEAKDTGQAIDKLSDEAVQARADFMTWQRQIGTVGTALNRVDNEMKQQQATMDRMSNASKSLTAAYEKLEGAERELQTLEEKGSATTLERQRALEKYNAALAQARQARTQFMTAEKQAHASEQNLQRATNDLIEKRIAAENLLDSGMVKSANTQQRYAAQLENILDALPRAAQATEQWRGVETNLNNAMEASNRTIDRAIDGKNRLANVAKEVATSEKGAASAANSAAQAFAAMLRPVMQLLSVLGNLGRVLASGIAAAARTAASALGTFGTTAQSVFARLKSALASASQGFLQFGRNVKTGMDMGRRSMLEFYAAGHSVIMAGQQVMDVGQRVLGQMSRGLDEYMAFEQQSVRAAIAGATTPDFIREMVFEMKRGGGEFEGLRGFSPDELAEAVYFWASAIGTEVTDENMDAIRTALVPMLQMAAATTTEPEAAIKGILNLAMEFGINPRAIGEGDMDTAQTLANIAAQAGFLANVSTLETTDIFETFKMVGPMAGLLHGSLTDPGAGMTDMMVMTYLASEMGLRGGNVGRGMAQMLTSINDPTGPMMEMASRVFGIEESREAFMQHFLTDEGTIEGGFEGLVRKFATEVDPGMEATAAQMLAEMFTNNATRAMVTAVGGMLQDPLIFDRIQQELESENPARWLSQALLMTNDSIFANWQNLKNAWFSVQAEIIAAIEGPFKNALFGLSEAFWTIAEVIKNNPWIGEFIAGLGLAVGVILSAAGAALMFGGGLLVTMQGLSLLSRTVPTIGVLLLSLVKILAILSPALLGLALLGTTIAVAWESDFMGMRSAYEDFVANFSFEKDVAPKFAAVGKFLKEAKDALFSFVEGFIFAQHNMDVFGTYLDKIFGERLGNALHAILLTLRDNIHGVREEIVAFARNINFERIVNAFRTVGNVVRGFLEQLVTGRTTMRSLVGVGEFGFNIGLDTEELPNFINAVRNAGTQTRAALEQIRLYFLAFKDEVASILGKIGLNLSTIITVDNLRTALQVVQALATGFAVGLAGGILITLRVIERLTEALTHMGDWGRALADYVKQWTGLEITLTGVARAVGVALGLWLGTRLVAAIMPGIGLVTRLGMVIAGVGLTVAGAAVRFAAFIAQVVLMGVSMAATAAIAVGQFAVGILTSQRAVELFGGTLTKVVGFLRFATVPMMLLVVGLGLLAAGFIRAYTTSEDFRNAVNDIVLNVLRGFIDTLTFVIATVQTAASIIGPVLGGAIGVVSGVLQAVITPLGDFEGLWRRIGQLLPIVVAAALVPTIGALVAMVAPVILLTAKILLVVAAIAVVIEIFKALYNTIPPFRRFVDTMLKTWHAMQKGLLSGWAEVAKLVAVAVGYVTYKATKALVTGTVDMIQGVISVIPSVGAQLNTLIDFAEINVLHEGTTEWDRAIDTVNDYLDLKLAEIDATVPINVQPPSPADFSSVAEGIETGLLGTLEPMFGSLNEHVNPMVEGFIETFALDAAEFTGTDFTGLYEDTMRDYASSIGVGTDTLNSAILDAGLDVRTASQVASDQVDEGARWIFDEAGAIAGNTVDEEAKKLNEAKKKWIEQFKTVLTDMEDELTPFKVTRDQVLESIFAPSVTNLDFEQMARDEELYGAGTRPFIDMWAEIGKNIGTKIRDELKSDPELSRIYGGIGSNFMEVTAELIGEGFEHRLDSAILGDDFAGGTDNLQWYYNGIANFLSQRYGVDKEKIMEAVPRWLYNEETVRLVEGELIEGLMSLPKEVVKRLNNIDWSQFGSNRIGIEWSDLVRFADVKAQTGQDWDLVNYIAERWMISRDEAERVIRGAGVDPAVISEAIFPDLDAYYAAHPGGDPRFIAGEMWDLYEKYLVEGTPNAVRMTQEEWSKIPQAAKIAFESMGLTVVIDENFKEVARVTELGAEEYYRQLEEIRQEADRRRGEMMGLGALGPVMEPAVLAPSEPMLNSAKRAGEQLGSQYVLGLGGTIGGPQGIGETTEATSTTELDGVTINAATLNAQFAAVANSAASEFSRILTLRIPLAVQSAFNVAGAQGGGYTPGAGMTGTTNPIVSFFTDSANDAVAAFSAILTRDIPNAIKTAIGGSAALPQTNPSEGAATAEPQANPFEMQFGMWGFQAGQKFREGLKNALDPTRAPYDDIIGVSGDVTGANPFSPTFAAFGADAASSFSSMLEADLKSLGDEATRAAALHIGRPSDGPVILMNNTFASIGRSSASSMMSGLATLKIALGTFAVELAQVFELGVKTLSMHAYAAGTATASELLRGLNNEQPLKVTVGTEAAAVVAAFQLGLNPMSMHAYAEGVATKSELLRGLGDVKIAAGAAASGVANEVRLKFAPAAGHAYNAAVLVKTEFARGLADFTTIGLDPVIDVVVGIGVTLQTAVDSAYQYGFDVVSEFARGMTEAQPELDAATQETRDKLPSSPAKKGPLSEPISFQYVVDALLAAMQQAPPIVDRSLRDVMDHVTSTERRYSSRMEEVITKSRSLRDLIEHSNALSIDSVEVARRRARGVAGPTEAAEGAGTSHRHINREEFVRTAPSDRPIVQVHIDNVTINENVDIDRQVDRIDRLTGQRTELLRRGQRPLDNRRT